MAGRAYYYRRGGKLSRGGGPRSQHIVLGQRLVKLSLSSCSDICIKDNVVLECTKTFRPLEEFGMGGEVGEHVWT